MTDMLGMSCDELLLLSSLTHLCSTNVKKLVRIQSFQYMNRTTGTHPWRVLMCYFGGWTLTFP